MSTVQLELSNKKDEVAEYNISKLLRRNSKKKRKTKKKQQVENEAEDDPLSPSVSSPSDALTAKLGPAISEPMKGLQGVIARLEKKYCELPSDIEEDSEIDEDSDEEYQQNVDQLEEARINRKRTRHRWITKKVTKEEDELFQDGEGFLADEVITVGISDDLPYEGFFVHRGPLLSKEKRKRQEQREKQKEKINVDRPKKKRQRRGSQTGKESKPRKKKKKKRVEKKETKDQIRDNYVAQLKRVERLIQATDENDSDEFPLRLDGAILSLATSYDKCDAANKTIILTKLHALLPKCNKNMLKKHMERVKAAAMVKKERKAYLYAQEELKAWVNSRLQTKRSSKDKMYPAGVWIWKLDQENTATSKTLEPLYLGNLPKATPDKRTDTKSEWAKIVRRLRERQKAYHATKKQPDQHDLIMQELCLGYAKRRSLKKPCEFSWNTQGISLLQKFGEAHKKSYEAAITAWKYEKELLNRTKSVCKERDSAIKDLLSLWPPQAMQRQELNTLTQDSYVGSAKPRPVAPKRTTSTKKAVDSTSNKKKAKVEKTKRSKPPPLSKTFVDLGYSFNLRDFDEVIFSSSEEDEDDLSESDEDDVEVDEAVDDPKQTSNKSVKKSKTSSANAKNVKNSTIGADSSGDGSSSGSDDGSSSGSSDNRK